MHGTLYVVTLSHNLDDFPVCITDNLRDAKKAAKATSPEVSLHTRRVFKRDANTPVGVFITKFVDGLPVSHKLAVDFT